MALRSHPLSDLRHFLANDASYLYAIELLDDQGIELEVTRERKSVFGNFQISYGFRPKVKITVNGNLKPYHFFITLLHELAHYYTARAHGPRVKPHGKEWQNIFSNFLRTSVSKACFPEDLASIVIQFADKPKASSCTDLDFYQALYSYENNGEEWNLLALADIHPGEMFLSKDGRTFKMVKKLRKNYLLEMPKNSAEYIAPPTLEVKKIS